MDPIDFMKIIILASIFVLVPLIWVLLRGKRSGDPEDAHMDYRVKDDTRLVHPRLSRGYGSGVNTEWFKILNEKDLRYLLTTSPIRLTIAYSLLAEGPATYTALHEKVIEKLEENFRLKVSENSYVWHFDWLVDAMVVKKEGEYYRLDQLPANIVNLINEKFRTKMKE